MDKKPRIFKSTFASIYPMYVQKAERKGRKKEEVDTVICWLTGYDQSGLQAQIEKKVALETFFEEAPQIHPDSHKITGVICGVRLEEITDPLMQKIRWLDKLVDELAKGKAMEKVLRLSVKSKPTSNKLNINVDAEERSSNAKTYEFEALIQPSEVGKGGAYVVFPYDIRTEFGKGRVKVHATFDGEAYDGSIVNMGAKNDDDSVCYIIGILKSICTKIGKQLGDTVQVTVKERE
ncbi:hypothetical protein FACS189418_8220 [Clostridia bacterium]|nr:hypothetical protein FACS189418_8220 [Clostridia bacterium]